MSDTADQAPIEVLLIEDNETDVLLVKEALNQHQLRYNLQVFPDGEQALRFLEQFALDESRLKPDFMLLDLNTPRGNSQTVLERSRTLCPDCVVVITSASDSPADRAAVLELGAAHFFRKPIDLDEFLTLGALVKDLWRPTGRRQIPLAAESAGESG